MVAYWPRVADALVDRRLAGNGGVIIEGPKACGKTMTATQFAKTVVAVDLDENLSQILDYAPQSIFAAPTPILFDEWQTQPRLWNLIRREIDRRGKPGQFLLSGSATPAEEIKAHSGLGRFARVRMRPMTAWERGVFQGGISLQALLREDTGTATEGDTSQLEEYLAQAPAQKFTVADLLAELIHGGWPLDREAALEVATEHVADYLERLASFEIFDLSGSRLRNTVAVKTLLRSLAGNTATAANDKNLLRDVSAQAPSLAPATLQRWLAALQALFVIETQEPWEPNLRSKARLRKSAVRHFCDASLAAGALGVSDPAKLLRDPQTAGLLFESFAHHQVQVFAEPLRAEVCFHRDSNGYEFDQVLVLPDGRWAGIEVKLGAGNVAKGIAGLLATAATIDTTKVGEPAALILLVGGIDRAYYDQRGVTVIPLQLLEP